MIDYWSLGDYCSTLLLSIFHIYWYNRNPRPSPMMLYNSTILTHKNRTNNISYIFIFQPQNQQSTDTNQMILILIQVYVLRRYFPNRTSVWWNYITGCFRRWEKVSEGNSKIDGWMFKGLYLYTGVVLFHVEWCIR